MNYKNNNNKNNNANHISNIRAMGLQLKQLSRVYSEW